MRISKLLMPAVTVAGALALAGCGGGSSTPTVTTDLSTGLRGSGPDGAITNADCARLNGTGSTANAGGTGCTGGDNTQTTQGNLTGAALLIASDPGKGDLNRAEEAPALISMADYNKLEEDQKVYRGLGVKPGDKWHTALGVTEKVDLTNPRGGAKITTYALASEDKEIADFGINFTVSETDTGEILQDPNTTADAAVTYMGIQGNLVCNDASACSSAEDKLTGDWYFIPTTANVDKDWVKKGKIYIDRASVAYADWGVWLGPDSGTGAGSGQEIRWFRTGHVTGSSPLDYDADTRTVLNSATYTGKAHGVSRYKAAVGTFMAEAKLTAKFNGDDDTGTTLGGEITEFTAVNNDAVNEDWKLILMETAIASSSNSVSGGSIAIGQEELAVSTGGWTAELYGEENKRPDGVVGDFDGRFGDGQAVGVFQAN